MRARYLAPMLCLVCACYESIPVELGTVHPGTKLRISLTDAGSDSLARYLGPGVQSVDGKLIQTTDSGVSLSVSQIAMRSGLDQFWKGETVVIPKYTLATVQQRRIAKTRSILLGGVLVAALASLRLSGVVGGNSGGGGTGVGGPR